MGGSWEKPLDAPLSGGGEGQKDIFLRSQTEEFRESVLYWKSSMTYEQAEVQGFQQDCFSKCVYLFVSLSQPRFFPSYPW